MLDHVSWPGICYSLLMSLSISVSGEEVFEATIIYAGHVLAIPGQEILERQSIVVRDNIITQLSAGYLHATDIELPTVSVRIIDLGNAFLLPGLIDSHVHLASAPGENNFSKPLSRTEADLTMLASAHARITLQAGFTTIVDLGAAGIPGHENAIFGVRDAGKKGIACGPEHTC